MSDGVDSVWPNFNMGEYHWLALPLGSDSYKKTLVPFVMLSTSPL